MIRRVKGIFYRDAIEKCQGNSGKLWKQMNDLKGSKVEMPTNVLEYNNQKFVEPADIANAFNEHFSSIAGKVLSVLPATNDYEPTGEFLNFMSVNVPVEKMEIPFITVDEVNCPLQMLNVKKATGEDGLAARYLKDSATVLAEPLCKIINQSFHEGKFPTEWKCAKVIALDKGGKRSVCDNYRPISILPVLSKVMEADIHKALYKYLYENRLISPNQSGFRPMHSCQTVLVNMTDEFNAALNRGYMIGCVVADLRKAFDVISHEILLKKLRMYGCDDT